MVTPAVKREAAAHLRVVLAVSELQAGAMISCVRMAV